MGERGSATTRRHVTDTCTRAATRRQAPWQLSVPMGMVGSGRPADGRVDAHGTTPAPATGPTTGPATGDPSPSRTPQPEPRTHRTSRQRYESRPGGRSPSGSQVSGCPAGHAAPEHAGPPSPPPPSSPHRSDSESP